MPLSSSPLSPGVRVQGPEPDGAWGLGSVETLPCPDEWMAAHGARRLLAMARNVQSVIGIELLAAAQGCDFHSPLTSSPPLEGVRGLLRGYIPHLEDDRHFHPDMALAIGLVGEGDVVKAAVLPLPEVA